MEENMKPVKKAKKKWTTGKIIGIIVAALVLIFLIILCVALVVGSKVAKTIEENPELAEEIQEQIEEQLGEQAEAEAETNNILSEDDAEAAAAEQDEYSAVDMDELMKYGSFSYTDEALVDEYRDLVVAKVGDHELTNGMFQIFYWNQFQSMMNQYGQYISYLGLDTSKPLSEQNYGETVTWEQEFVREALDVFRQYCALYDDAKANGVEISEAARNNLDNLEETMTLSVTNYGYATIDEYLKACYGPGVTFEDYKQYNELYAYALNYAGTLEDSIDIDDAAIEAYFDENEESYAEQGIEKIDLNMVDVRHILIQPEQDEDSDGDGQPDSSSDEAWDAAEKKANEVYAKWQEDPTEDNFAALAAEASSDPGSATNGGLYQNVYPGQMVVDFDEWCFDEGRKPGDNGIVETEYGYHIMYFSKTGDETYWHSTAKNDCIGEQFDGLLNAVFEKYGLKVDYKNLHIYDMLTVTAQAAAAQAAAEVEEGVIESAEDLETAE